ncbi:Ff.00g107980.m01.CDS01 [Fusarium sp. VM40]|nr:Ff.00g107980.m01.CDS01 [Fusarium sp. VM40]
MKGFHHLSETNSVASEMRSRAPPFTYEPFQIDQEPRGLGKAIKRRLFDWSEFAALLLSFTCGVVGLVVCFRSQTAADMGQKYQLIIVGLTLSVMDLCTSKISTVVFLQLETRWASLLQNYDVIVKKSVLGSALNGRRGDQRWTLLLFVSLGLPLVLSVGYKAFIGGRVTFEVEGSKGIYGLTGPPGLGNFTSGYALMVNATIPLMFNMPLKVPSQPQPYGFNMLLLNEKHISVAMLDGPSPEYVETIRQGLHGLQSYSVAANVNGLAWKQDKELEKHRNDVSWWNSLSEHKKEPSSIRLYKEKKWFTIMWPESQLKRFFLLLRPQKTTCESGKDCKKVKPTEDEFREQSIGFISQWLRCHGKWSITLNTVDLVEGYCYDNFEQTPHSSCDTLHLDDAVSILSDFVGRLDSSNLTEQGQIQMTAGVSALFWSRLTAYCGIDSLVNRLDPDSEFAEMFKYERDDTAFKTVGVLRQSPLLALVLLAQPIIGLVLFIIRIILRSSPISGGFGLISVLSGHTAKEGSLLRGAGLSGEVAERIELNFNQDGEAWEGGERLRFQLREARNSRHHERMRLMRGIRYY